MSLCRVSAAIHPSPGLDGHWSAQLADAAVADTAAAGQDRSCLLAEQLLTIIRHVDQLVLLLDGDALALQLCSSCVAVISWCVGPSAVARLLSHLMHAVKCVDNAADKKTPAAARF